MSTLAYALAAAAASVPLAEPEQFAQLTIERRVIIRVPVAPAGVAPAVLPRPLRWKEAKGPKCIPISRLAGAVVADSMTVDLFIRGGMPVRAKLDRDCQRVDLRYGFYLRPNADNRICGGRDMVHARTGGQCEIERFRALVPER